MSDSFNTMSNSASAMNDARVALERATKSAIGDLVTSPAAALLSPVALGSLVTLVRHCGTCGVAELSDADIRGVLGMRGLSASDIDVAVQSMRLAGLVVAEAGLVRIPSLALHIQAELAARSNRKAGWETRRQRADVKPASSVVPIVATPAVKPITPAAAQITAADAPAQAAEPPAAAPQVAVAGRLSPAEPREVASPAKPERAPATRGAPAGGIETRRFTESDSKRTTPSEDPVSVRIPVEKGVAELTQSYVDHLQSTYGRIDVLEQLKRAALWCESNKAQRKTWVGLRRFVNSWLSRASQDADVRRAVVRAGSQRNGFGQGGDYASGESDVPAQSERSTSDVSTPAAGALSDAGLGDFSDLLGVTALSPEGSSRTHDSGRSTSTAAPAASTTTSRVLATRSRLFQSSPSARS